MRAFRGVARGERSGVRGDIRRGSRCGIGKRASARRCVGSRRRWRLAPHADEKDACDEERKGDRNSDGDADDATRGQRGRGGSRRRRRRRRGRGEVVDDDGLLVGHPGGRADGARVGERHGRKRRLQHVREVAAGPVREPAAGVDEALRGRAEDHLPGQRIRRGGDGCRAQRAARGREQAIEHHRDKAARGEALQDRRIRDDAVDGRLRQGRDQRVRDGRCRARRSGQCRRLRTHGARRHRRIGDKIIGAARSRGRAASGRVQGPEPIRGVDVRRRRPYTTSINWCKCDKHAASRCRETRMRRRYCEHERSGLRRRRTCIKRCGRQVRDTDGRECGHEFETEHALPLLIEA